MGDDDFEDWSLMVKELVSMYRTAWVEVERQFPTFSVEERQRICSLIFPFLSHMFAAALNEDFMEYSVKGGGKRKKKR